MKTTTAKNLMDMAYRTSDVDTLRRLCQIAVDAATGLDAIITEQIEFNRRHTDRCVEATQTSLRSRT